jgi:hypothetical protein
MNAAALKGPFCQPRPQAWVKVIARIAALKGPFAVIGFYLNEPFRLESLSLPICPRPVAWADRTAPSGNAVKDFLT